MHAQIVPAEALITNEIKSLQEPYCKNFRKVLQQKIYLSV